MVKCKENYIGRKFNHLKVIKQTEDYVDKNGKHYPKFICECDCNIENPNITEVLLYDLKSGHTSSCGCLHKAAVSENNHILKSRPMEHNSSLKLNLIDDTHTLFGKCKTQNTNEWFYFSMCDYDKIKNYCWFVTFPHKNYHRLTACINRKNTVMHKLLGMNNPDHINRNPLDNRRENLDEAVTTLIQNQNHNIRSDNTSNRKGVYFDKERSKWIAQIYLDGKHLYLGRFKNKDDAIIARIVAEQRYFQKRSWQMDLMREYGRI